LTTSDEQVDAAILAALREADGGGGSDVHPWAVIRRRLPGTEARQSERLVALWHAGRVWLCKVGGSNYVALGDTSDRVLAARAKAEGRVRAPLVL